MPQITWIWVGGRVGAAWRHGPGPEGRDGHIPSEQRRGKRAGDGVALAPCHGLPAVV